ncbi:hypothetical protein [uncultured Alistipes sp.]|uniref:hypothetical protein n=1 Tax=uncultured Alistipes sp. TaxID=538949 RepID=UPI002666E639|nr:hypothetical protein [uncultured Alistipes sp.]
MSEETKKNPIQLVTELLAEMTARVVEAEQQRDEAQKNSDEWYAYYQKKDAELKETAAKLAAEIEEHQKTRQQLREALNNQEGDQDHGESN